MFCCDRPIGLIDKDRNFSAFTIKWIEAKKTRVSGGWRNEFPEASFNVITTSNYLDYIS